jgi:acyl dehydratase
MPISSRVVGYKIPEITTDVTTRMLMAYAAGIGECSPCFFDDASGGGIVATPSFCTVLEWPVTNERIPEGGITDQEAQRIVRIGQDSTFYRPIKPGEKLQTSGCVAQVKQTSAGALIVQKVVTVNAESLEPVVTSWVSLFLLGGEVEGEDREIESSPQIALQVPSPDELVASEIFIPRKTPHVYAECSGIWNPINTERKVALATGLPDIILQGMATWSIAGREILKDQGVNNPHRMKRFTANFSSMIIPGATIRFLQGRCRSNPEAVYYSIENQKGETAASGFAFLETI